MKLYVLPIFFFLFVVVQINATLTRFNLTEVLPDALCNDGTPAVYYFNPGSGDGVDKWVIRMMGGGWCWDVPSCKTRESFLTSSKGCQETMAVEGILSTEPNENPNFYNFNHVYLYYCSSDSHLGTKYANESINGWYYLGKLGVQALITHLMTKQTPSLSTATEILITGDSAGGVGAMNNADYIWSLVSHVIPNAHYRAYIDAGSFLDIPAYGASTFSFQMVAKNLFNYWGAVYDQSCVEYYGVGNEWHCFHAQYAWPHLDTRTFFQEFEFDHANLDFDGIKYPFSASEQNYTENFQQSMLNNMAKVPYIFLPNCYKHEVIDSSLFTSIKIGNTSIAESLWHWYSNPSSSPPLYHVQDICTGFNCNPTCPPPS